MALEMRPHAHSAETADDAQSAQSAETADDADDADDAQRADDTPTTRRRHADDAQRADDAVLVGAVVVRVSARGPFAAAVASVCPLHHKRSDAGGGEQRKYDLIRTSELSTSTSTHTHTQREEGWAVGWGAHAHSGGRMVRWEGQGGSEGGNGSMERQGPNESNGKVGGAGGE